MKFFRIVAIVVGLFLLLATGCFQGFSRKNHAALATWMSDNGKLKVLCTTAMIADLAREIGGDKIDCLTLIEGESDPHSYQLVKGDDEKIARADLVFSSGLGLEHGPSLVAKLKKHPKAFAVGDYVQKVRPEAIVKINSHVDPHIWMDVSLWKETVPFIANRFTEVLPEDGPEFRSRAENLESRLDELHHWAIASSKQSGHLVTSHEAFNYFAKAYLCPEGQNWQERVMAPEGLAPDSQLSTADIQRLVDYIINHQVKCVFAESNVSHDSLKKLVDACRRKGFEVRLCKRPLYADAMGPQGSGADSYMGMIRHDVNTIAKEL